jgi:DMSO/TMAO reductase YedYZ molybdopterin-dependent catalytic subunit
MSDKPDLVERRQKYIQRQIELDQGAVDVTFRGRKPAGAGPANRHGMPKLPVGQHEVKNWPVLDLGEQPDVDTRTWKLDVGGLVDNPFTLTWDEFLLLPQVDDVSDFHCVTTWSRHDNRWRGIRFRTIAELAVPREEAKFALCAGYDFMPGSDIPYTTNLPLARAIEADVLLVHTWEGRPLPREHGGPCRMITPKLYAWTRTPRSHGSMIDILQTLEARRATLGRQEPPEKRRRRSVTQRERLSAIS